MNIIQKAVAAIVILTNVLAFTGIYASAWDEKPKDVIAISQETIKFYEYWKTKYLTENSYVTDETQYYVFYGDSSDADGDSEIPVTVSEAHGYGMLIAASMEKYDREAKEIFDGMYRYYRAHCSEIGSNLMAWQQVDNGGAIVNASGADSATDGDMDIAYALLMADAVWGSDGEINYKEMAIRVIRDIMTYEVNKADWILQLGDWVSELDGNDKYSTATRSSDFIMQYMPIFAEVTGDNRWLNVYESTYAIINKIVSQYHTGILPDFLVKDNDTGEFVPASANFLESENDGNYYYNSCRTPWRISMDYLINGNADALRFATTLNNFISDATGGDAQHIVAGYTLDGTPLSDWNDLCFDAPFLLAASCGGDAQWYDAVRNLVVTYEDDVYYGDTIKMLCLLVDDGGWIVPDVSEGNIIGDVNADGFFSIADVIAMQKYLLCADVLNAQKAGDLNADDKLDGFDLCRMKQMMMDRIE